MTPQPSIGVVVITRNEERDIRHFLQHLVSWVDEIIVVDDGSTDRTVELCRAHEPRVKVVSYPMGPNKDFGAQRNRGIDASSAEWLLHMDADNRVTPALADELKGVISSLRYVAYRYRRLNFFLQRPFSAGGWQDWNEPWLARRDVLRFDGRLHEGAIVNADPTDIGQLRHAMWHLGDESFEERIQKTLLYSQLTADRLTTSQRIGLIQLVLRPIGRAFKAYIIRGGFLQGTVGIIHAVYTFSGTFNWYAVAWDRQNRIARERLEQAAWGSELKSSE